ncbi:CHAP domain-containing protein [Pseudomonas sp. CFBP 8772]|uniref:CHAP domain-containing protein n=1 Tax=Pseudomonas sp. CFBP 8772 TaxID=2775284 RepID=UPI0011FC603B|nr:CHAP domain-containing protein [Pseudomonas sp. CFBP 8772]RZI60153.1 MAG: CHAP domain-containing protein [Pseudomonas sp.]
MTLSRRDVLVASTLAAILPRFSFATDPDWVSLAQADTQEPIIPSSLGKFKDQPSINNDQLSSYTPFGTDPATAQEVKLAMLVLNDIPKNCTPIEIALYFHNVGQGNFGEERRPYATAWPVRWNPVIVEFFKATQSKPRGDTTAWCAAFINYCLMTSQTGKTPPAGASHRTQSARALSFKNWGEPTNSPRPGDIVVFQNVKSPNHGHVGFFLADQGSKVLVLGGNQFEGTPVRHTISRKSLLKDGPILKLLSYRTEEQLHA